MSYNGDGAVDHVARQLAERADATALSAFEAVGQVLRETHAIGAKLDDLTAEVATVAEVKNSWTVSNSRNVLANPPADAGRAAIWMSRTWSKMRLASVTSARRPATSM